MNRLDNANHPETPDIGYEGGSEPGGRGGQNAGYGNRIEAMRPVRLRVSPPAGLETIVTEAKEKFNGILEFSLNSKASAPHRFEKRLFQMLLELGRIFLHLFFSSFGRGDQGREISNGNGEKLKRCRLRKIDYVSIFGKVEIERYYYWSRGVSGVCPLDGQLNLPGRVYSYYLQEIVVRNGVGEPYERTLDKIEQLFGFRLSPRSLMDVMQDSSRSAEDFRSEQPGPEACNTKDVLVVSVDGKGVPMRKERLSLNKSRLGKGEKNQKKKMSAVAAVYSIDRNVRSARDVLSNRKRGKEQKRKSSPRPYAKRVRARLGDKLEKENFLKDVRSEADKRCPESDKLKVFLCDGERFYWRLKEEYFSDYTGVLDLYHVMEKLWDFSHCFKAEGSREAEELVSSCLVMLLEGNGLGCIEFMKTASSMPVLGKSRKKTICGIVKYLERNVDKMRYDKYLAMGIPIGSGNVESACKNLIKDRMEGCGMRWSRAGADAMLALRAIYLNGDLGDYFEFHIDKERKRLYQENSWLKPTEPNYACSKLAELAA